MQKSRIDIIEKTHQEDIFLGTVEVLKGTVAKARSIISNDWPDFLGTGRDSYVDYLVKKYPEIFDLVESNAQVYVVTA